MTDNERIYKCEERYNKFLASCVSAISSDLSVQLCWLQDRAALEKLQQLQN